MSSVVRGRTKTATPWTTSAVSQCWGLLTDWYPCGTLSFANVRRPFPLVVRRRTLHTKIYWTTDWGIPASFALAREATLIHGRQNDAQEPWLMGN